jgi:hypothetical protein
VQPISMWDGLRGGSLGKIEPLSGDKVVSGGGGAAAAGVHERRQNNTHKSEKLAMDRSEPPGS